MTTDAAKATKATVRRLFTYYCEELVSFLDYPGGFWPRIADNTISNRDLHRVIELHTGSGNNPDLSPAFSAATSLLVLREIGVLPSPKDE